ncbi:MAG TPA: PAS domain S-box protein, partial [Planctomycetaceae bacterium]|nr:PAS domain S-box protein [Planctomycetaceae bacterium]
MARLAPFRLLILSSQSAEADQMAEELRREALELECQWADNEANYLVLLAAPPDIVLCETGLLRIDAMRAMQLLHERDAEIPFLIVSEQPDVNVAVDAMRRGAADYLSRARLHEDLSSAVTTALKRKQQRHAENLHQSAAVLFREVVEHSLVGIQILQDGKYAYANRKLADLFGYEVAELLALESWTEVVAEGDRDRVVGQVRRRVTGETPHAHYFFQGLRKDGTVIDVEVRSDRTELNGRPAVIGTLVDVTERRRTEAILRDSEERFRSAFERSNVAMVLTSLENRFIKANAAFARMFGYSNEEVLGLTMADITHPEHLADSYEQRELLLSGGGDVFQMEKRYLRKDGQILWGLTNVSVLRHGDGRPHMYVGQVQDITDRKRFEESLREEKDFSETVIESVSGLFYVLDKAGLFVRWNGPMQDLFGATAAAMRQTPALSTVHEADRDRIAEMIAEVFVQGHAEAEARLLTKVGVRDVLLSGRRLEIHG